MCCMEEGEKATNQFNEAFPDELIQHASATGIFGGEFNFEKMNELKYWSKEDELEVQGFRTILVTEEVHPYIKYWWPPGHLIGYQNTFVNEFGDFFQSISKDSKVNPDFYDGWKANQVLDAVSKSIETETWQEVDKM